MPGPGGGIVTDNDAPVTYLSYCCYFRCGDAHEVGFVDPGEARRHMVGVHNSKRVPTVKRWPHSTLRYQAYGVAGPLP